MNTRAAHSMRELPTLDVPVRTLAWRGAPGKSLLGLFCLYVVLVPSLRMLPVVEMYNGKRLLEIGVLVGIALYLLVSRSAQTAWVKTFLALPRSARWLLGVIVALGLGSSAYAALPVYAFLEVAHTVLLGVAVVAVARACLILHDQAGRWILMAVTAAAGLYLVGVGVNYAGHQAGLMPLWPQGGMGFSNIRFFNHLQTWTLPLIVLPAAVFVVRSWVARVGLYSLAAAWWMLLIASGGRGTAVGMAGAAVFVALVYRKRARRWFALQGWSLLAGALLYLVFFVVFATAHTPLLERGTGDSGRWGFWTLAVELVRESPWLGVGPVHYAYLPFGATYAHPHNVVLQWAAEWGLPATVLLVVVVGWGFVAWVGQSQRVLRAGCIPEQQLIRVALTATLVAAGIHALLSGITVMPLSQIMLVLIIGWSWGLYRARYRSASLPVKLPVKPLRWGLIVMLGLLLWGLSRDVPHLQEKQEDYAQETGTLNLRPRYWQQGFIGYENGRYRWTRDEQWGMRDE